MHKLCIFVPETHAEALKNALFAAGAGRIGNYEHCSFETSGIGQFRPLQGAQPFLGNIGGLERVKEKKIEMVCEDHLIKEIITALKKNHPYETPAYDIIKLVEI